MEWLIIVGILIPTFACVFLNADNISLRHTIAIQERNFREEYRELEHKVEIDSIRQAANYDALLVEFTEFKLKSALEQNKQIDNPKNEDKIEIPEATTKNTESKKLSVIYRQEQLPENNCKSIEIRPKHKQQQDELKLFINCDREAIEKSGYGSVYDYISRNIPTRIILDSGHVTYATIKKCLFSDLPLLASLDYVESIEEMYTRHKFYDREWSKELATNTTEYQEDIF